MHYSLSCALSSKLKTLSKSVQLCEYEALVLKFPLQEKTGCYKCNKKPQFSMYLELYMCTLKAVYPQNDKAQAAS